MSAEIPEARTVRRIVEERPQLVLALPCVDGIPVVYANPIGALLREAARYYHRLICQILVENVRDLLFESIEKFREVGPSSTEHFYERLPFAEQRQKQPRGFHNPIVFHDVHPPGKESVAQQEPVYRAIRGLPSGGKTASIGVATAGR
ncbi:MAG TPA: hypothetical protein VE053_09020 [Allosphingosinicella sp.]|nr:hypothetical protein [Allosphingosinicella sp.]